MAGEMAAGDAAAAVGAGHWIQTASGGVFVLDAPTAAMVNAADIGAALAKLCRFNGHSRGFYSVAQHSVLVALLAGGAADEADKLAAMRWGLLHDAHEAYLGDMTRPLKRAMGTEAGTYLGLCDQVDWAVRKAFGLADLGQSVRDVVKAADLRALVAERRSVMASAVVWPETDAMEEPRACVRVALEWAQAEAAWVAAFDALFCARPCSIEGLWTVAMEHQVAAWRASEQKGGA